MGSINTKLGIWMALAILLGGPAAAILPIELNTPEAWPRWIEPFLLHPTNGWQQAEVSWWSCAWFHGSPAHKFANLTALFILIVLALAQRAGPSAALAWFAAWPLTHVGMIFRPELTTYIGLSGVLHAGATVLALNQIICQDGKPFKLIGWILLIGLAIKVILMENPWNAILIPSHSSDINVAPWAHLSGIIAGLICGGLTFFLQRAPQFKRHKPTPRELRK